MYCRKCCYDLRALPQARCPECGRTFNPSDPTTSADLPAHPPRWLARVFFAGIACSLLPPAGIVVTWLVAWASLGHPPRLGLDDPKSISSVVSAVHSATIAMTFAWAIGPLVAMVGLIHWVSLRRSYGAVPTVLLLVVCFITPCAGFWVLGDTLTWFAD